MSRVVPDPAFPANPVRDILSLMPRPLAWHITFGTYGTRLHGDPRGTVHHARNAVGTPIIPEDERRREQIAARLRYEPVLLTLEQREFVERMLPSLCERGGWRLIIAAAATDHVHVLVEADGNGKIARRLLKRWLTQALNEHDSSRDGPWWADGGSAKPVCHPKYLAAARRYVERQALGGE